MLFLFNFLLLSLLAAAPSNARRVEGEEDHDMMNLLHEESAIQEAAVAGKDSFTVFHESNEPGCCLKQDGSNQAKVTGFTPQSGNGKCAAGQFKVSLKAKACSVDKIYKCPGHETLGVTCTYFAAVFASVFNRYEGTEIARENVIKYLLQEKMTTERKVADWRKELLHEANNVPVHDHSMANVLYQEDQITTFQGSNKPGCCLKQDGSNQAKVTGFTPQGGNGRCAEGQFKVSLRPEACSIDKIYACPGHETLGVNCLYFAAAYATFYNRYDGTAETKKNVARHLLRHGMTTQKQVEDWRNGGM